MSLCLECGLCCDGTLFGYVVKEGGGPRAATLLPAKQPGCFSQPCNALGARGCSIYEDRPTACRTFNCTVLTAHELGDATLDEAREAIAELKSRRALVAELMGEPDTGAVIGSAKARMQRGEASPELSDALHRFLRGAVLFFAEL